MDNQKEKTGPEKLFDEINLKIVESGCTMQEVLNTLALIEIALKNAIRSVKKPPLP